MAIVSVAFAYSERFGRFDYGPDHPLRTERLDLTVALMKEYGLLEHPDLTWIEAEEAPEAALTSFHHPDYLAILRQANQGEYRSGFSMFGLGQGDNPVFPGLFDWAALLTGASFQAGRALACGQASIAFSISGGMHHALPRTASGFCYLNDVVITIKDMLDQGLKVGYVDIDAHHGDGVQEAFYDSDQVLTISLHQNGQTLFPGTGFAREQGQGQGLGYAVNIPLAPFSDDEVYIWVFDRIVPPLIEAFGPDVLVTQLGVDALAEDPLANLELTDRSLRHACLFFKEKAGKWLALGGGGYHLVSVARCWTQVLALMLGQEPPQELPARFLLRIKDHDPQRRFLQDDERLVAGSAKTMAQDEAGRVVDRIQREVFPLHGL